MKSCKEYIINIVTTGFFVLLILSIVLFWARWLPESAFRDSAFAEELSLSPLGLVPGDIETDPNVIVPSYVSTRLGRSTSYLLGIFNDFESRPQHFDQFGVLSVFYKYIVKDARKRGKDAHRTSYFDQNTGLFVYCDLFKEAVGDKEKWAKKILLYAGPEGISENPDENLGRFDDPGDLFGYDTKLRRFFSIQFNEKRVIKGPQLSEDYQPIQVYNLSKNESAIGGIDWQLPLREATEEEMKDKAVKGRLIGRRNGRRIKYVRVGERMDVVYHRDFTLVLDASGRIDRLDSKTLELLGTAGYLPKESNINYASNRPRDLLAYKVRPFYIGNEYKGLIAASVPAGGQSLTLSVFDADGQLSKSESSRIKTTRSPGGVAIIITQYILRNLHPVILHMASVFMFHDTEAGAWQRSLFIKPNYILSTFKHSGVKAFIGMLLFTFAVLLPSIFFGLFLAWRVRLDAVVVGISKRAKFWWTVGTICFGLSAYITYRVTRPKEVLVTCVNCGRLRRPSTQKCHRCGSGWQVPELAAPGWRVID